MSNFELPSNVRFSEECGLNLEFQEVRKRDTDEVMCQVLVTEEGDGHDVKENYCFTSWNEMKEQFPTMMSFLRELSGHPNWTSEWRDYDRIYFFASSEGHEGLYAMDETVWFDAKNEYSSDNPPPEKTKKTKIKK